MAHFDPDRPGFTKTGSNAHTGNNASTTLGAMTGDNAATGVGSAAIKRALDGAATGGNLVRTSLIIEDHTKRTPFPNAYIKGKLSPVKNTTPK